MPGPTIAYAEVKVDLDGKRIPQEARRVGEESGAAMGEAHEREFNKKVDQSYGDFRDRIKKEMRSNGELSGQSFTDAFQDRIKANRSQMIGKLADIFAEPEGLDRFRASMGELGEGVGGVDTAVGSLNEQLLKMHGEGLLLTSEYDDLKETITSWGDETRTAAVKSDELEAAQRRLNDSLNRLQADESASQIRELRLEEERVQKASKDLGDTLRTDLIEKLHQTGLEMDRVHGEAIKVNEAFDNTKIDQYIRSFGRGEQATKGMKGALSDLLDGQRANLELYNSGAIGVDKVGDSFERNRSKIGALSKELKLSEGAISDVISGGAHLGEFFESSGGHAERFRLKLGGLGKGLDGIGGKLKNAFSSISQFDPFDNVGQAILLVIGLLGPLANLAGAAGGGLLILGAAGVAGAAGVGLLALAFKGMFGDLQKLPAEVRPAAAAMQGLKDDFAGLQDTLQIHVFSGLEGDINRLAKTVLPVLNGGFAEVGDSLNGLLRQFTVGIQTPEGLTMIRDIFKDIAGIMTPLGGAALNLGKILGQVFLLAAPFAKDFAEDLQKNLDNFSKFLDSPKGHSEVTDFLQKAQEMLGKVGDVLATAVEGIGELMTPENFEATMQILDDIGASVPGIVDFANSMVPLITAFADFIPVVANAAAGLGHFADGLEDGINGVILGVVDTINLIMGAFSDLGNMVGLTASGLNKFFHGDYIGAAGDFKEAMDVATASTGHLKDAIDVMNGGAGAAAAALRIAGESGKQSLDTLSTNFGLTGAASQEFQGIIASTVHGSAQALGNLKNDKSLDTLIRNMGLSSGAATQFRDKVGAALAKTGQSYQVLDQSSKTALSSTARQLGVTGNAAKPFERALSDAANGSRSKIKALASAGDLASLEHKLGITGSAAKTQFANRIISAMNETGGSIGKLPPKIQALVSRFGTIPKNVYTNVTLRGAESAISQAAWVGAALGRLPNSKTINITQITKQIATRAAGANGGVFNRDGFLLGGTPMPMANGGILRNPTRLAGGSVLAGEAGPEAIVPLTGALSKIDPSVRSLAAAARGLQSAAQGGTYIAEGAIVVQSPAKDPAIVAEQVMDRLVPLGG